MIPAGTALRRTWHPWTRLGAAVAVLVAVGMATATASQAAAVPFDIATGTVGEPSIYVEPSGTAHVAWSESVPGGPDVLHYCRVPRGRRACTGAQSFVPLQDYATGGNGPAFNTQFDGVEILPVGDQLVVMTHRYPNVVQKPDGSASSDATYLWSSGDDGQTFAGPVLAGDNRFSGGAVAFGAGMIGTITDGTTGGTFFQAVSSGGYAGTQANLGDTGPDQAYDGSLAAVDATSPVAAFDDLGNTTYLRQYSGAGDLNDVGSWLPPVVLTANSEPRLAGGPKGVFLITHADGGPADGRYVLRHYASGGVLSSPVTVSPAAAIRRALSEDAGGAVHVAWFDRTTTAEHAVVQARASADGVSWGPVDTLADVGTDDVNGLRIAGAADGTGFAVWTSTTAAGAGAITMAPYAPDPPATVPAQTDAVSAAGVAALKLSCHPPGPCSGSVRLLSRAAGTRADRAAPTVLAHGHFSVKGGRTGTVRLHLNAAGRRLLKKSGNRLRVTASVVSVRGGRRLTATGLVTLKGRHR